MLQTCRIGCEEAEGKVLHPIIWSKSSIKENTTLIVYLMIICLQIIISKLDLFVEKEVTNAFTNQSDSMTFTVPWAYLILRSLLEMMTDSVYVAKRKQCVKMQKDLTNRLQTEAFSKVHDMSVRWNIEKGFGEIKSLVESGAYALWSVIEACLDDMFPVCASVLFSFIYISTRYSILTGIIVVCISTLFSVPRYFYRKWSKQFRDKEVEAGEEAHSRSMDSLSNFQTVKNFACEDNERKLFRELKEKQTNSSQEKQWWSDLFYWCMDSLTTIFSLGITLYGAHLLSNGQISYGEYVLLTRLFLDLYYSTYKIYCEVSWILDSCEQLNKTVNLLNETPEITDKKNATDIQINTGRIEFKNVTFSYAKKKDISNSSSSSIDNIFDEDVISKKETISDNDGNSSDTKDKKEPALADISFTVEAGQCLALVGPTGSGKSTIAKLLTRMYDIHQGNILIDHEDISEVTMKSLRSSIGIVPQEVELFNDKIRDNIKYGCPHATEEEIIEAASKAEIHEKIIKLEDKYESKVGNKGLKLSGGERQRIGIARVFLKDPKIVILDEATSALDTITEKKIQGSLEKAYKGKTSVVIAHRLSTICNADQIIVLDQGKVAEKGSHQELLKLGGMYTEMWNQQTEKGVKTKGDINDNLLKG